jgi:hypothetical protein
MTPANIIPMRCGMRNLPIRIGANRMIHRTIKNIHVGSVIGKYCDIVLHKSARFINDDAKVQKKYHF